MYKYTSLNHEDLHCTGKLTRIPKSVAEMYGCFVDQRMVDLTEELKKGMESLQNEVKELRYDHSY